MDRGAAASVASARFGPVRPGSAPDVGESGGGPWRAGVALTSGGRRSAIPRRLLPPYVCPAPRHPLPAPSPFYFILLFFIINFVVGRGGGAVRRDPTPRLPFICSHRFISLPRSACVSNDQLSFRLLHRVVTVFVRSAGAGLAPFSPRLAPVGLAGLAGLARCAVRDTARAARRRVPATRAYRRWSRQQGRISHVRE